MRPRWTWYIPPLVAAGVLAGCGSGKAPTTQIEKKVRADVAERTHLAAAEASCPDDIKARKGAQFDCVARVEEQSVPMHVTLLNKSGTRVDIHPTHAVMLTSRIVTG